MSVPLSTFTTSIGARIHRPAIAADHFRHPDTRRRIMFTGIVQGTAEIVDLIEKENFRTHRIRLPAEALVGLEAGASVAHNGCCL